MLYDVNLDGHILNIIQNNEIFEQNDLQEILGTRGYKIPQATLSRRLKKLKIAKIAGTYKVIDFNQPHLPLVLNIQVSDFGLIVLHTHPGQSNGLAYYFDQKYVTYFPNDPKKSGILGTIAGDDTVLLVLENKAAVDKVRALLREEFPYLGIA